MSTKVPQDEKLAQRQAKLETHDHRVEHIFRRILHLLEQGARKRGMLISGGEVDTERMAKVLLDEFRGGKLGRFTLETPEDLQGRKK